VHTGKDTACKLKQELNVNLPIDLHTGKDANDIDVASNAKSPIKEHAGNEIFDNNMQPENAISPIDLHTGKDASVKASQLRRAASAI